MAQGLPDVVDYPSAPPVPPQTLLEFLRQRTMNGAGQLSSCRFNTD
ncbi:TPA: hypothetical protein JD854_RS23890 [Citrobacter amalonaticus]|uniref:Uncharacterized protein n=1 Tax=Citrobacter amalonaticus TaxID=35703 RepID=A0A9C7V4S7_CITAM|nr:hypothetical protein [Citrobacter amalonaticus]